MLLSLKPNSLERVKEWAKFIKENEISALGSLQKETVTVENFFFVTLASKDYLIGYMRARSFEIASTTVKKSLSKIDAYHKEFQQETWVNGTKAELMVNLSRIHNEDKIA